MSLTTAVRNNGVGMVIATGAFPGTPAVTAAMIYGLVGFLGSLLLALAWGRRGTRPGGARVAAAAGASDRGHGSEPGVRSVVTHPLFGVEQRQESYT